MLNAQRLLIHALATAAPGLGVAHQSVSTDWVQVLQRGTERHYILGFKWPLNTVGASALADDKAACATVLAAQGVAAVPHHLIMAPAFSHYVAAPHQSQDLLPQAAALGYPVVIKDNAGMGGGVNVYKAADATALQAAAGQIFSRARAAALCPFVASRYEYRLVMLEHEPLLIYRKIRPQVVGDGARTLAELVFDPQLGLSAPQRQACLANLGAQATHQPALRESVLLDWRHNLDCGARPEVVPPTDPLYAPLAALGAQATRALGLRFVNVDILTPASGPVVMEVNSGVCLDKFATALGATGEQWAIEIYTAALRVLFPPR